jgi:hypothetical protein
MKKSQSKFRIKLHDKKDFPKIKIIPRKLSKSWGKGRFVLPSPLEVNTLMKRVPKGKLTTINEIRKKLAKKYKTTTACPIVTGIFAWISANAAEEDIKDGRKKVTPYWRTIKSDGKINEKYPGGVSLQKKKLFNEKHEIVLKGKNYFVKNFENKLAKL